MIAGLEGLDLLVFTGGIGEHDAMVRAEISRGLSLARSQPPSGTKSIAGRSHQAIQRRVVLCECSLRKKTHRSPFILRSSPQVIL